MATRHERTSQSTRRSRCLRRNRIEQPSAQRMGLGQQKKLNNWEVLMTFNRSLEDIQEIPYPRAPSGVPLPDHLFAKALGRPGFGLIRCFHAIPCRIFQCKTNAKYYEHWIAACGRVGRRRCPFWTSLTTAYGSSTVLMLDHTHPTRQNREMRELAPASLKAMPSLFSYTSPHATLPENAMELDEIIVSPSMRSHSAGLEDYLSEIADDHPPAHDKDAIGKVASPPATFLGDWGLNIEEEGQPTDSMLTDSKNGALVFYLSDSESEEEYMWDKPKLPSGRYQTLANHDGAQMESDQATSSTYADSDTSDIETDDDSDDDSAMASDSNTADDI